MTRRLLTPLLAVLLLALAAPAAQADRADDLLLEACRTGKVTGSYSQSDYRKAISRIPADSDQYTDCRSVLRRSQLSAAGGGAGGDGGPGGGAGGVGGGAGGVDGGAGGGGGIDPATGQRIDPLAGATPEERAAVERAGKAGGASFELARGSITPGRPGGLQGSDLPPALIVLVALLGALALGGAGWAGLSRVRPRRGA